MHRLAERIVLLSGGLEYSLPRVVLHHNRPQKSDGKQREKCHISRTLTQTIASNNFNVVSLHRSTQKHYLITTLFIILLILLKLHCCLTNFEGDILFFVCVFQDTAAHSLILFFPVPNGNPFSIARLFFFLRR